MGNVAGNHEIAPEARQPPTQDMSQSQAESTFRQSLSQHQKAQFEYQYLAKLTHFDENTLRLLHSRFLGIDRTIREDGAIDIEEFAQVLGVPEKSLLLQRLFQFMDKSGMGSINFRNFATAMSMLSNEAKPQEKMELTFFLYDQNNDKVIDRKELKDMVVAALSFMKLALNDSQIETIIDNTFKVCDLDSNGLIDFEEYCKFCKENPRILQPFSMDISRLIEYEIESRRKHRYRTQSDFTRVLHHGMLQSDDKGRFANLKRKMGKGLARVKKDQMVPVKSIHAAEDVCIDIEEEPEEIVDEAGYLTAGKPSDYILSENEDFGYESEADDNASKKNTPKLWRKGSAGAKKHDKDENSSQSKKKRKKHHKKKRAQTEAKDKTG